MYVISSRFREAIPFACVPERFNIIVGTVISSPADTDVRPCCRFWKRPRVSDVPLKKIRGVFLYAVKPPSTSALSAIMSPVYASVLPSALVVSDGCPLASTTRGRAQAIDATGFDRYSASRHYANRANYTFQSVKTTALVDCDRPEDCHQEHRDGSFIQLLWRYHTRVTCLNCTW